MRGWCRKAEAMAAAEAEWEPAGLLSAPGDGLDWGERGELGDRGLGAGAGRWGAPRRGRAGAEAAVSPAEAVLGDELSELLGAAEPRRAPRDEPDVSTERGAAGGPLPSSARPRRRCAPTARLGGWRRRRGISRRGAPWVS